MSGHRPTSPQFDIVASTRRSWSREQKRAIVAEVDATGASISEVARRQGIHASQLFRWRREFGAKPAVSVVEGTPTFVPVVVDPRHHRMPVSAPSPSPTTPTKSGIIEIMIAGGRAVRVGGDVDTAALVRIIEALEGRR